MVLWAAIGCSENTLTGKQGAAYTETKKRMSKSVIQTPTGLSREESVNAQLLRSLLYVLRAAILHMMEKWTESSRDPEHLLETY